MSDQKGLQRNYIERTIGAREKAIQAINILKAEGQQVNFSSISRKSGVSRHFLYGDSEVRNLIEEQRRCDVDNSINRRARYDKTSKSKDVIIAAKDKKILKLEEENKRLRTEVATLRGLVYASGKSTSGTCTRCEESSNSGG